MLMLLIIKHNELSVALNVLFSFFERAVINNCSKA